MRQARVEGEPPVAVLMSVSKRKLRHAVDRNRTKRQLREAYRLNKQILWRYAEKFPDESIQVAFIWISDKLEESSLVHRKMVSLMQRIVEADERRNLQAEHDKAD